MIYFITAVLAVMLAAAYIVHRKTEKVHQAEKAEWKAHLETLEAERQADKKGYAAQLAQMLQRHQGELGQARVQAVETSRRVIRGQVAEQLVPFMPGFPYEPSDCKFFGQPIDLVVFDGMSSFRDGDHREITVVFADVKTGRARLTPVQRAIRDAIRAGRVKWADLRTEELLDAPETLS